MFKYVLPLLSIVVATTSAVQAGSFKEALAAKKVCEKADGFIQATSGNNEEETSRLVDKVNAKRTGVYTNIAQEKGTTPEAVAFLHAKEVEEHNRCK